MEWAEACKIVLALGGAAAGLEKMLKLFRRLTTRSQQGFVVVNGSYDELVRDIREIKSALPTLRRIETRVEEVSAGLNNRMDAFGIRLASLEQRRST